VGLLGAGLKAVAELPLAVASLEPLLGLAGLSSAFVAVPLKNEDFGVPGLGDEGDADLGDAGDEDLPLKKASLVSGRLLEPGVLGEPGPIAAADQLARACHHTRTF
jgi:hypothetical protein